MKFEKRSAYIEFVSQNMVKVVTPYADKSFTLAPADQGHWIDLVKLKKVKPADTGNQFHFYGIVQYDTQDKSYSLNVYCRVSEEKCSRIDIIALKKGWNEKKLSVSITLPD